MTRLGLSSVGVTLGGLLTLQGITYVLTENKTISYPNMAGGAGIERADRQPAVGAQRRRARGVRARRRW